MIWHHLFKKPAYITILHTFKKPPWGGGNQFLLALKKALEKKGYYVNSTITPHTRLCIYNSFTFNPELLPKKQNQKIIMAHRIDGPTIVVRGSGKQLDDEVFMHNRKYATTTIFQSYWSLKETLNLGYKPKNPIIITNAVNPEIFNNRHKFPYKRNGKVRIIATSWSTNLKKGFDLYRYLDDHLNWDIYQFTFVGNSPYTFRHIQQVPAQPSEKLAVLLQQHDIYITASQKEACSNALIEGLSCGLPALYYNDSSNPEIVGFGGLGFTTEIECIQQLADLSTHYYQYQQCIFVPSMDTVARKYLELLNA